MNGSGCRAPDSGDHRSGAYTGGPHHRMSGEGGAVGGAAQCTAPAGLIRETVTNVTAIDTWRPYHALHTSRCPINFQLSCGYPAWLAFQVTTNVMTSHSWQQNCFEHLHWIVKLPASILVTVWATEQHQTAADGHCDCVFHDWDIVMCPNTGHFAASEEKLLLPRCDGLIRYVKIGNRNWSSAGVGLGRVVQMKCSNQESVCWRNCSAGQHTPRQPRDQEGKHGRGLVLVSCWHVAICADRN